MHFYPLLINGHILFVIFINPTFCTFSYLLPHGDAINNISREKIYHFKGSYAWRCLFISLISSSWRLTSWLGLVSLFTLRRSLIGFLISSSLLIGASYELDAVDIMEQLQCSTRAYVFYYDRCLTSLEWCHTFSYDIMILMQWCWSFKLKRKSESFPIHCIIFFQIVCSKDCITVHGWTDRTNHSYFEYQNMFW